MKKRAVVAMSGGVDSSVAACLLKKQGYEVIGLTMCFNLADSPRKKPACCGIQGIEDARRVAHKIGIKHYVVNMQKPLQEKVIADFVAEYLAGRTPNPCVRCNQYLKFDLLLKKALALEAQFLATGHYARIARVQGEKNRVQSTEYRVQKYTLKKAADKKKDQSYFLYRLTQHQLRHALFPLGGYTKEEVRKLARNFGLSVADKPGSQEICFLPQVDYRPFLEKWLRKRIQPGQIVDKEGNILGEHKGVAFYTIGQREGLGVARGYPVYIAKIDAKHNRITVSEREGALKKEFFVKDAHFISAAPQKKIAAAVKIRYNHKEAQAVLEPLKNKIKVTFKQPQFAITPGQSAVFYDRDTLLGGGIIEKVSD